MYVTDIFEQFEERVFVFSVEYLSLERRVQCVCPERFIDCISNLHFSFSYLQSRSCTSTQQCYSCWPFLVGKVCWQCLLSPVALCELVCSMLVWLIDQNYIWHTKVHQLQIKSDDVPVL